MEGCTASLTMVKKGSNYFVSAVKLFGVVRALFQLHSGRSRMVKRRIAKAEVLLCFAAHSKGRHWEWWSG
jgi:hypothetical protein